MDLYNAAWDHCAGSKEKANPATAYNAANEVTEYVCEINWEFDACYDQSGRVACEGEAETDCGWIYWDPSAEAEYWVTCEDWDD